MFQHNDALALHGSHFWEIYGALTGYAGGIDRKLKLLRMEGAEIVKKSKISS